VHIAEFHAVKCCVMSDVGCVWKGSQELLAMCHQKW